MARIAGVDIPREKRLEISLTYIFGVGRTTARQVCGAVLRQSRTGAGRELSLMDGLETAGHDPHSIPVEIEGSR